MWKFGLIQYNGYYLKWLNDLKVRDYNISSVLLQNMLWLRYFKCVVTLFGITLFSVAKK